jgi:hypothetical protein
VSQEFVVKINMLGLAKEDFEKLDCLILLVML